MWAVGVLTYVLTVMQRTSLGVAGLEAAKRFGISPGVLAAFVFIQVTVYVAAQTPAGLLVDRFGPRIMLIVSGVFLTVGQLVLASGNARANRLHSGSELFNLCASLRKGGFVRLGPLETQVFVAFHPLGLGGSELNLVLNGSGLLGGGNGVELNAEASHLLAMVADFAIKAGTHRFFTAQRRGEIGRLALSGRQRGHCLSNLRRQRAHLLIQARAVQFDGLKLYEILD